MAPRASAPGIDDHHVQETSEEFIHAPAPAPLVNNNDAVSKKSGDSSPSKTPSMFRHTFHYEMNVVTFGALGLIYQFLIPAPQKVFMHVIFALIALDAGRYYYYKGSMPGVPYTLPFVSLVAMVIYPVRFWNEMAQIAMESGEGMCSNILGGNFLVFITDVTKCRQVMTGEGTYGVYAHPNAFWLFDPANLIYMDTEPHKKFRAILTPALFSNEALTQYAAAQERVCRKYLAMFAQESKETGKPICARVCFRKMAAASSQEAFLGPYLNNEQRQALEQDIMAFTAGFLCFPFPYLNTGLHKAVQAKNRIEAVVEKIVPLAMEHAKAGKEPRCMIERWSAAILEAAKEQGLDDPNDVPYCDERNMARTVLDFLFASQDATNSALAYSLDILDAERDVLQKMRKEVLEQCGKGHNTIFEKIRDEKALEYTCRVANQMLHHKPPVPMIPHLSKKASEIGGHHIPKGTVCIPSITYSARTSGASVDFLPDRPDQDSQFVKTVVFGAGQHKCPGRRYAESLLAVHLAILAQEFDFSRTGPRPGPDDFMYYPTVFPVDSEFNFVHDPAKVQGQIAAE